MKSELRLIKNCLEYLPKDQICEIPRSTRGIYVLYKKRVRRAVKSDHFDVVYVGMARRGIRGRITKHRDSKGDLWSHFSFFEVWNNIADDEIAELEGLFRHLYRFDSRANKLNIQKGYKKLAQVRNRSKNQWI